MGYQKTKDMVEDVLLPLLPNPKGSPEAIQRDVAFVREYYEDAPARFALLPPVGDVSRPGIIGNIENDYARLIRDALQLSNSWRFLKTVFKGIMVWAAGQHARNRYLQNQQQAITLTLLNKARGYGPLDGDDLAHQDEIVTRIRGLRTETNLYWRRRYTSYSKYYYIFAYFLNFFTFGIQIAQAYKTAEKDTDITNNIFLLITGVALLAGSFINTSYLLTRLCDMSIKSDLMAMHMFGILAKLRLSGDAYQSTAESLEKKASVVIDKAFGVRELIAPSLYFLSSLGVSIAAIILAALRLTQDTNWPTVNLLILINLLINTVGLGYVVDRYRKNKAKYTGYEEVLFRIFMLEFNYEPDRVAGADAHAVAPIVAPVAGAHAIAPIVAPVAGAHAVAPIVAPVAGAHAAAPVVVPVAGAHAVAPIVAPVAGAHAAAPMVVPGADAHAVAPTPAPSANMHAAEPIAVIGPTVDIRRAIATPLAQVVMGAGAAHSSRHADNSPRS